MTRCQCANERRPDTATKQFRWGGCSDNVKHGKRVARNFLELQPVDSEGDESTLMLRHDSEVGIAAVMNSLGEKCKCHGKCFEQFWKVKKFCKVLSCSLFRCFGQLQHANMLAKTEWFQHNVSCTSCEIPSSDQETFSRKSFTSCSKPRAPHYGYDRNRLQWAHFSRNWSQWVTSGSQLRTIVLSRAVTNILCRHKRPTMHQSR
jgi:hypothetical protein